MRYVVQISLASNRQLKYKRVMNNDVTNKFICTLGVSCYGDRVWLSADASEDVHAYLMACCKWGGPDKRTGHRVSYELRSSVNLEALKSDFRNMGMVDCSGNQSIMNALADRC